jgi:hypothetical protein
MRLRVFLLAGATALLAAAAPAHAAVYTVTNNLDPGTCDGLVCTGLQAALDAAANNKIADEVDLKKTTYAASKGFTIADGAGVTVVGVAANATTLTTNGSGVRVLGVSGTATLTHLKVTGGTASDLTGGGIFNSGNLTLDHVEVSGNHAVTGAGIANQGTLSVAYSLITGNVASSGDGGILNSGPAGAAGATLSIHDTTVAFNTAGVSGVGGIAVRGASDSGTLQRVTVADNAGGGRSFGGIGIVASGAALAARATIVAGNTGGLGTNCTTPTPTDNGFNVESGTDCAFKAATDKQNANPGFPTGLVDDGGETDVLPIPSTSPAVDLGPACSGVTDQRDLPRPQGKTCDAGAYEVDQAPDIILDGGPSGLTNNRTPQFTFHSDEPGVSFMCKLDGSPANTFTSCGSPATYALTDGPYTFSVEAIDGTHSSPPVASTTFTVDATAPAAPAFTAPANNAFLNTHSVTLQGTAEAGASVRIQEGQLVDTTVTASGTGAWSAPLTVAEGTHNYTAFATDAAGNASPASATRTITVDTDAPAAPTITTPAGNITQNSATVGLSGGAEPNATVKVLEGSAVRATVSANGQGLWSASFTAVGGVHTYAATATDLAGNVSGSSASRTITIDTVAPNTTITAPPPSLQSSRSVSIAFTATESGSSFQCELDGPGTATGSLVSCTSPKAYSSLPDGSYTFSVTATDAAGNTDQSAATASFAIDGTAPAPPAITSPADNSLQNSATVTLSGTAEVGATVEIFEGTTSGGTTTATGGTWTKTIVLVSDGSHTYTAKATDAAGNVSPASATRTVRVDTTPPAKPAFTAPADNALLNTSSPTLSGTAEAGATVEVFEGTTSRGTTTATGGAWSKTLAGVADGTHTYTVRATDPAANTSAASDTKTLRIDTTAPAAPAITSPANQSLQNSATVTLTGTADAGATVEVFEGATSRGTTTATGGTWTKTLAGVADGRHVYTAKATDAAGNVSAASATRTVDVDTGPPDPPDIAAGPALQNTATVVLGGTAESGATVEVFEGATSRGTTTATAGAWTLTLTDVAEGAHTYTTRATDVAHNVSGLSSPRTVTVDTTPPSPPTVESGPSGVTSEASPSFTFAPSDGATTIECSLTGPGQTGAFAPCASPASFSGLAPGDYVFTVRARDAAGNTTTSSRAFTVAVPQQAPSPTPTPTPTPSPTPVANQTVVVQRAGGTVLVRRKGTNQFVALDATQGIPLGSEVDTRHGKVNLSSVPKAGAQPQTALFFGGLFVVTQSKGVTQLALSERLAACPRGRAASAAAKKKKPKTRNLWGDGHGSFRTKGQYSAATVRGTKWNVQDSCAGTLTRVARGVVAVNDFVKHKTKVLRAGQRYLAKPRR